MSFVRKLYGKDGRGCLRTWPDGSVRIADGASFTAVDGSFSPVHHTVPVFGKGGLGMNDDRKRPEEAADEEAAARKRAAQARFRLWLASGSLFGVSPPYKIKNAVRRKNTQRKRQMLSIGQ